MDLESQTIAKLKEVWNTWDIRVFMLISLLIQALLTILAPYRIHCSNALFRFCVWLLYLSADAVALFTIGLISSSNEDSFPDPELAAFWAPFLLLHLGGPDTITALALEDNELWLRHGLQLATQATITLYVFVQSVRAKTTLWLPMLLMFVDGCIKYIERTCALYFASADTFLDQHSTEVESIFDSHLVVYTPMVMIKEAYTAYKRYKALLVDNAVNLHALNTSRNYFLRLKLVEVLENVEIQLNFIYEAFYTKKPLLMMSKIGFLLARVVSFLSVVTSLVLFNMKDKSKYHKIDVVITFVLLVGAIALDFYASVKLVASTWFIIRTCYFLEIHCKKLLKFLCLRVVSSSRRWSKSILQYNLLACCQGDHPPLYFEYVFIERVKDVLIGWFYVHALSVDDGKLVEFITETILQKYNQTNDAITREIDSAKGVQYLQTDFSLVPEELKTWITELEYDEILLTMHVATDLCHRIDDRYRNVKETNGASEAIYYEFSKQLSDYMLYIILRQQAMVSSVAGFADIQFEQTVNCGRKLMQSFREEQKNSKSHQGEKELEEFSKYLGSLVGNETSKLKEEHENKVVFYNACLLAEKLRAFEDKQWEITSKVWVDILCYGASRSQPRSHVERLNAGGELITIAWLIMAHLGLTGQFQESNRAFETEMLIWKSA